MPVITGTHSRIAKCDSLGCKKFFVGELSLKLSRFLISMIEMGWILNKPIDFEESIECYCGLCSKKLNLEIRKDMISRASLIKQEIA